MSAVKFKPAVGWILISRSKTQDRSSGGLFIPEMYQEKAGQGLIVATCEGSAFSVGATVLWVKYAGVDLDLAGEQYTLIRENEILGQVL